MPVPMRPGDQEKFARLDRLLQQRQPMAGGPCEEEEPEPSFKARAWDVALWITAILLGLAVAFGAFSLYLLFQP